MSRLAVLSSHPVQYYAPLFVELAKRLDLHVYYTQEGSPAQQSQAGFGTQFSWDLDLLSGYESSFLSNVAVVPDPSRFWGADTPGIAKELRKGRFDAFLTIGWYLKAQLQGILAAKGLGLPVLVRGDSHLGTNRGMAKRLLKAGMWPLFLRQFDAALFVGLRNEQYLRRYHYPRRRMFHSPHAIDNERFRMAATEGARWRERATWNIGQDERVVLFAGKLVDFKHPLDAVRMVARLREDGRNVSLMIAGSGPLEEALQCQARQAAVPARFLGFQNQSRLPAIYAAADALILPSSALETWGLVCNEAIASGTPVVVSDQVGCAPDLTGPGRAGTSFQFECIEAGAQAMLSVLENPPSPAAMRTVAHEHSIPCAVDGILRALDWLSYRNSERNLAQRKDV